MRNQPPVHKPALVAVLVTDDDGNRRGNLFGGAMLKRGVYFGGSWSKFQRTRMSLNSNVAVMRRTFNLGYLNCRKWERYPKIKKCEDPYRIGSSLRQKLPV